MTFHFVLFFSLVPLTLSAQADAAAWALKAASVDYTSVHLRDLHATPLGSDSVEIRVWHDVSLTRERWMTRAFRAKGVWHAERIQIGSGRSEALPDSINWARRWDLAQAAGLDSLPTLPVRRPPVPGDDGESAVIEWSSHEATRTSAADNPSRCFASSDRVFVRVLVALSGESLQCGD